MANNEINDRIYTSLPERHERSIGMEVDRAHQPEKVPLSREHNYFAMPHAICSESSQAREGPQRIWGMSVLGFTLTIITITAVVVGAAIGGGPGSVVARRQHGSTSAAPPMTTITKTATVTTSSAARTTTGGLLVQYQVAAPSAVSTVPLDCPAIDNQAIYAQSWRTNPFAISCTQGLLGGDIGAIIAYTFEDCIDACGAINLWQNNDTACVGVQFGAGLAGSVQGNGYGNCFLKNAGAGIVTGGEGIATASQAST